MKFLKLVHNLPEWNEDGLATKTACRRQFDLCKSCSLVVYYNKMLNCRHACNQFYIVRKEMVENVKSEAAKLLFRPKPESKLVFSIE